MSPLISYDTHPYSLTHSYLNLIKFFYDIYHYLPTHSYLNLIKYISF